MMTPSGSSFAGWGSALASVLFLWSVIENHIPPQISHSLSSLFERVISLINPNHHITIPEYSGQEMRRSPAYSAIEAYLSTGCCVASARRLKGDLAHNSTRLLVTVDDKEEVTDEFDGARLRWTAYKVPPRTTVISWFGEEERRYYCLSFHRRYRNLVIDRYLPHVIDEGRAVTVKNRRRRLYTNSSGEDRGHGSPWSHVVFEHPSTFDTLAMDPEKKRELIEDLAAFRDAKDYYAKIGKAWKRGYLLYGPPGTGKSSMIAAIANFMEYDIYDLELTSVKSNTDLRKLFIETTGKSVIVIEDIDCSLDLTGKRNEKKKEQDEEDKNKEKGAASELSSLEKKEKKEAKEKESKVTLSGLLNFIDGLWSACGGERIIVFTTNHLEKLDPALIRRGRMDKRIEMTYCGYDAFRLLARNYLDVETHQLFDTIERLLGEVNMTPADVAENLMPMSAAKDADKCLERLVQALEVAKEEAAASASTAADDVVVDGTLETSQ